MSTFNYNSVRIHLLKSLSLEAYRDVDKLAGVDTLWQRYTIRGRGVISQSDGDLPTQSRVTWAAVKHMLETPRRSLLYTVAGTTMLTWTSPAGLTPDAGLGPEPLPAVVREICEGTFFVEFGYILRIADCDEVSAPNRQVVSLRWTQSESFDEAWKSKITTRGKLVVRADLSTNADDFRPLTVPPVLSDYRRLSSDYVLSPSGTELDFTFVDLEEDRLPPFPAVKASGRFTVTLKNPGILRFGQVDVSLTGQKGTKRSALLNKAFAIAYSKLQSEGFDVVNGQPVIMLAGTFSEDLFEPAVNISVQARLAPLRAVDIDLAINIVNAGNPKGLPLVQPVMRSSDNLPFIPDDRPGLTQPVRKRLEKLLAAAFRDPCASAAASRPEPIEGGDFGGGGDFNLSLSIGETPDFGGGGDFGPVADDQAPYEQYEVQSQYGFDMGSRALPGTGSGADGHKAAVVTVHGGLMTMDVSWVARRTGSPPVLPSFQSKDPNLIPLKGSVVPTQVDPSADGVLPNYTVAGHYTYLILDPTQASVLAPLPPFLGTSNSSLAAAAAGQYSDGILWNFQGSGGANPFVGRAPTSQSGSGGQLPQPQVNA